MGNIVGVWRTSTDQFEEYIPYVYTNNQWVCALPYAYTENSWKRVGGAGTLYIPFMTSSGDYFYTSDGKIFLVKNHE